MIPIGERVDRQDCTVFAAYEVLATLWPRVEQLVTSGRRVIYIERWLDSTGPLRVDPGQVLETRGFVPGAHFSCDDVRAGFQIALTPGIDMLGVSAHIRDGTEAEAARRFHEHRDATRVHVVGFGSGRGDHVEVTDYNERGVGRQRLLYFDLESHTEHADRDAEMLRWLASHGNWSPEDLQSLAEDVQRWRSPAAETLERLPREQRRH